MFEPLLGYTTLADAEERRRPSANLQQVQFKRALRMYEERCRRGRWRRLRAWLMGRTFGLFDLSRLGLTACHQYYAGLQSVRLDRIIGSENRAHDFDGEFNPRRDYTQGRWVAIAMAHMQGHGLPAITLLQVGDVYFVRDGHHRVSVALAWGQVYIDAEVTVLDAPGPWPWERPQTVRRRWGAARGSMAL